MKEIRGRDDVARFLVGINRKGGAAPGVVYEPAWLNGSFGLVAREGGRVVVTAILDMDAAGQVTGVWLTLNPEKLTRLDQPIAPLPS
jgi:hypothetical protein